jgi:hypothetical protein
MPRLPINYANTVIYKIVCNDLSITECYVGYTTDFVRRKQEHKRHSKNEKGKQYNYIVYQRMNINGGWDNYSMIEIEKYPCNDANEACTKEREWYEKLNCKMNNNNPHRCRKEWREVNKDELARKNKEYREINKVKIAINLRDYYMENKDKILEKRKTETFACECGREIKCSRRSRHQKSNIHLKNLKSLI